MRWKVCSIVPVVFAVCSFSALGDDLPPLKFPSCNEITNCFGAMSWVKDLQQIPATVIDTGVLKDVPYNSFKAGDYELNVYGDPSAPACVEIGIYQTLFENRDAMKHCAEFISSILPRTSHKDALGQMHLARDWKKCDGIIVEITPPQDEDAYGGWWVSAYFEKALDKARASKKEMTQITIPKDEASSPGLSGSSSGWSRSDMKLARPTCKLTELKLPHLTIAGREYKNVTAVKRNPAEVKVYFSGVAITMPIEDFNEEHRKQLGYNIVAAEAYKAAVKAFKRLVAEAVVDQILDRRASVQQQVRPQANQLMSIRTYQSTVTYSSQTSAPYQPPSYQSQQPQSYSSGTVYVRGYYRSNGTYVQGYTRSAPSRR